MWSNAPMLLYSVFFFPLENDISNGNLFTELEQLLQIRFDIDQGQGKELRNRHTCVSG